MAIAEISKMSMVITYSHFYFPKINSVGLEKAVIPVRKNHKAAHRRLIYTDKHGLVDVPSNLSWIVRTKPPFSKPLLGVPNKE